jgi:hypothetical protein
MPGRRKICSRIKKPIRFSKGNIVTFYAIVTGNVPELNWVMANSLMLSGIGFSASELNRKTGAI